MKTEIEWLNKKLEESNCFINIPENDEKQKRIVRLNIKMFSDRLKEIEEFENNELIEMEKCYRKKNFTRPETFLRKNQFDVSFGNIQVLRLIPDIMNDNEFRVKLRKLALDFMVSRGIR